MKKRYVIFVVLIASTQVEFAWPKAVTGMGDLALTSGQVQLLSQKALDGSGRAANRLSIFYLAVRGNRQRSEYWARISAENGSPNGEYNYAQFLLQDSKDNITRAIFWFKKAAAKGQFYAKLKLVDLLPPKK